MMDHNDFPQMTDEFDQRVRMTLDALPEKTRRTRRPFRTLVTIGVAAALCVSGTAFAANAKNWFPTLFRGGDDNGLSAYVAVPDGDSAVAENGAYRLEVEAFLFDESAQAGTVSLHLTNLKGDGVMPFACSEAFEQYRSKDSLIWSSLTQCYASEDGEADFNVLYGESEFCGSRFYLDKTRSTENDYYIEGAFVIPVGYAPGDALRVELNEIGKYVKDSHGSSRCAPMLTAALPAPKAMPSLASADGNITLSQIGLRIAMPGACVVDDVDYIAVKLTDGSEVVLQDEANEVDRMLYACGGWIDGWVDGPNATADLGTYALGEAFALEDVASIVLNDTEYPLS